MALLSACNAELHTEGVSTIALHSTALLDLVLLVYL